MKAKNFIALPDSCVSERTNCEDVWYREEVEKNPLVYKSLVNHTISVAQR